MKYVLDASVAVSSVILRPLTAKALRVREDYRKGIHDLLAPSVFSGEAASALTKSERQKLIPVGQALVLLDDILNDLPQLYVYEPLLRRATAISSKTRAGLYDCLYVALAEQEGCELLTADDKAIKNLQPHFPFIVSLATMP